MSNFGERFGFVPARTELTPDEMPSSLRNALWDAICIFVLKDISVGHGRFSSNFDILSKKIWFSVLKLPADTRDHNPHRCLKQIRDSYFRFDYIGVYEFIEWLASQDDRKEKNFTSACNKILERELSAFRFADKYLVRISDTEELSEIENSVQNPTSYGVSEHIQRAAQLYSQRPSPDYRNSVKESISAVESAVRNITGEKSVGVAKPLRKVTDEFEIHPALRDGFEKLYAFTSDKQGVRHAILDKANINQYDARYMLVSCSAFANYLLALKIRQQG